MATDAVQQIKERLSIVDVIAPYAELHKAGKSYKGKSPFTNEKTPSFYVSPDRGMYYCFSSSQGGDMFTFIEKMEGVDFKGALKILAEKAGVELVPEDPQARSARDRSYALLEDVTTYFSETLKKKSTASAYLADRGVKPETVEAWRVGYAPGPPEGGWRELREHLGKNKWTDAEMLAAGVIKRTDAGKEPYDVFRDRIMFPIADSSGRVVGFSGRVLSKESDAPKYVNSPETELFNKSEILFGYDKAKQGIRKFDFTLVVEGQFDVVLAHQAGYANTVAVSGTALTSHHVALLQRLSNRVVLALDADRAGIAAVKRAADLMLARGMDVKVARLPQGEDPADIIRKDTKQFKDMIGHATHVIEFLLLATKEQARDERTYKLAARDEIVPYLVKIESAVDREHFEGVMAEALGTTQDAIHLEVDRLMRTRGREENRARDANPVVTEHTPEKAQAATRKDALLAYFAALDELLSDFERKIVADAFSTVVGRSLGEVRSELAQNTVAPLQFRLEQSLAVMQTRMLHAELTENLKELRAVLLKEQIRKRRDALHLAERDQNDAACETLLAELAELQRELAADRFSIEMFSKE